MSVRTRDNAGEQRFEAWVDDRLAGFAAYQLSGGTITFVHTEVDDAFEGQGVGSALAAAALQVARDSGLDVHPSCPFIAGWIRRHPEHLDLVPESVRGRYGLA